MLPTIESLAAELAAGRTTSVELTRAALARAADPSGEGQRVFTQRYAERALALARASDALRQAAAVRSPIDGLPVSIKDLFDVAGETTCAGSVVLRDAAPAPCNAVVVDRLLAAGKRGDVLTATAREVSKAGRTGVYDIDVHNQRGQQLAQLFFGELLVDHRCEVGLVDLAGAVTNHGQ